MDYWRWRLLTSEAATVVRADPFRAAARKAIEQYGRDISITRMQLELHCGYERAKLLIKEETGR